MSRRFQIVLLSVAAVAAVVGLAVFLTQGTGGGSSGDVGLKPFTAADARFRASFPGTPKRTEQDMPAAGATIRLIQYTSDAGGGRGFSVGWFQLTQAPPPDGVRSFLEATQRGTTTALEATLVTSDFVQQDGHEAIEYVAELGRGRYVKSRTVVIGRDVYVLQVVGPKRDPDRYDDFVKSFNTL